MAGITRDSLLTLEAYGRQRPEFRARVMAHKKHRVVELGSHVRLIFEDELSVRYQVQEMLRAEKTFDENGIRHELETYSALVPDGSNLKATMMIEYSDPAQRAQALVRLRGIEHRVYLQVEGFGKVEAIADEDMERETEVKTSAVHFLRFELSRPMIEAFRRGAAVAIGVDHPHYAARVDPLAPATQAALALDFA